jgi:hypothetical protein
MPHFTRSAAMAILATAAVWLPVYSASADDQKGFLETIHKHVTLTTTIPADGDLNPYALIVAPVSSGLIQKDDILIDNFNDISNLQGTGTTIVDYNPATQKTSLIAKLPKHLPECPGGVGLTTAMTMLKTGWIIVGSTPSTDGTTSTKGDGCLIVLDSNGKLINAVSGSNINAPWGNMVTIDNGSSVTLFVSNAGFDVPSYKVRDPASGFPVIVKKATVLRIELSIAEGQPPIFKNQTVIADGLSSQANRDAFLVGPTGLALGQDGTTLYVSDSALNRIIAIPDAVTRKTSVGNGREVTKGGLLHRPLAMTMAPNGHLLVTNALNGQVVEIDPIAGKQVYAQWIDSDQAQSPPGNGDLFGITMAPDGKGFYYVEDDMNTIVHAQ